MPIVYLLLTAFVRQNALSVFLRFKSITNTNLGIAILAITLTFGQQQSVHPTAAKKKTDKTQINTISRTIDQI